MQARTAVAIVGAGLFGVAIPGSAQNLSTYGTPGLIDMPTAETLPDGYLALTAAAFRDTSRNTLTFQMLPWAHGSFRYAYIRDFDRGGALSRYDRSFDVHFQLSRETRTTPALAIGLRDFGGTGIYASEYLVATKTIGDRLTVTGGLGWGRLAGRGGFSNPLGILGSRFKTRPPANAGGIGGTGQLDFGNWFRGDAALFGGFRYAVNERLSLVGEYSSDAYPAESANTGFDIRVPVNLGLTYRFANGLSASGYVLYGSTLGVQVSYALDPRKSAAPGGQGTAAPALMPVDTVALASWNLPDPAPDTPEPQAVLRARLAGQGIRLLRYAQDGDTARVEVENRRYGAAAQAVGRTARAMANTLDPAIARFQVVLSRQGVPITRVAVSRDDLYTLENEIDGAWQSRARATIRDAPRPVDAAAITGAFPSLGYRFGPYLSLSFFDPDQPLRYETGADLRLDFTVLPGLTFSGQVRQPVLGNLDDATRQSNSVLPRVRSDWVRYARQSDFRITHLTGEYIWRPGPDLFARVTGGYLEEMFAGLSAELLWYPDRGRLALGGEVNYARQRDFDILFGFQDYDTVTGHASAYFDFPGDYHAQVDVGRYLAGDWGATFTLDRVFNNGFRVGAFLTLTDVSSADFGEGSFDKGIRLEIPLAWLTGRPSRSTLRQTIRPVLRDGGARLNVRNRLYEFTRAARAAPLAERWGRYFR